MATAVETFGELARLWAPPDKLTVSEWSDRYRGLARESSARPGTWKTRPYQRDPMDAFTDPAVHTIVLMVARQTLKTEAINNCIGYAIDRDPGPMLVVQFRDTDCQKWSKIRFGPMVRETPCLKAKVAASDKSRSAASTIDYKSFPGGHLSVVASASPGNLAALPIRYLYCDEIDKYPESSGSAGDPIKLAQGRQEEFWNRKTVLACTPTIKGRSRIEKAWLGSDQREYELRCPFCREYQIPKWEQVRFGEGTSRKARCEGARYICVHCERPWNDAQRWQASRDGRYRATAEFSGVAGFRVSGLARIGGKLSRIVDEWLDCEGNNEARKTFINEQLAELWEEPGETLDWEVILNRREPYTVGVVPAGGLFLTAGVDVQRGDGGRLEVRVNAYGENRERWAVEYRIIHGDPTELQGRIEKDGQYAPSVWERLEQMLSETWKTEGGADLSIERMFVDSGDGTVTPFVYEWVKSQPRTRVWAIKGDKRSHTPVGPPREVEITSAGRKLKYGVVFKIVDSDYFKSQFYADLKKRPPTEEERKAGMGYPQGYYHMPIDLTFGDEHCKQLCAESLRTTKKRNGRTVTEYHQDRARNEALDTQVYADAAAWDFGAHRFQEKHWEQLRSRAGRQKAPTVPANSTPLAQAAAPQVKSPLEAFKHPERDGGRFNRGGRWFR